jgi:ferrous iron transport protein A
MKEKGMTLEDIRPGNRCIVEGVSAEGALGQRLVDMGFFPGATIHVVRNAPFEDPVELEMSGFHVSIRHKEARYVEVE